MSGIDSEMPADMQAEQAVLGAMMTAESAVAECAEILRPRDFLRHAHQEIFLAIAAVSGRGGRPDMITVKAELEQRGILPGCGGVTYLHDLLMAVPSVASAAWYAGRVRECAIRRRIAEAAEAMQAAALTGGADLADRIAAAYKVLDEASGDASASRARSLADLIGPFIKQLEEGPEGVPGIATGWADLNHLIPGFRPGEMVTVGARQGMGKALALDTPIPTPCGWTTMGEIQPGDYVIGDDGKPARVIAATAVMTGRPCFEMEFGDGTVIVADAQHEWLTETRRSRRSAVEAAKPKSPGSPFSRDQQSSRIMPQIRTTAEIAATLRTETADAGLNHSVVNCSPVDLPAADLPVPPYTLGAWLGDGDSNGSIFTCNDMQILDEIRADGNKVTAIPKPMHYRIAMPGKYGRFTTALRQIGVLNNKHIPVSYLRASEDQRRALLAGLLDTDGYCMPQGTVILGLTNEVLARDARELVSSLGYTSTLRTKRVHGRSEASSICYIITFTPPDKVFRLSRKLERQCASQRGLALRRFITDVRPCESVPVRCIQVDSPTHMYVAGPTFIPTHNSLVMLNIAVHAGVHLGVPVLVCTLEMSADECIERILACQAGVELKRIRGRTLEDRDWDRIGAAYPRLSACGNLLIDDDPYTSLVSIRSDLRAMRRAGFPAQLVVVDYLGLIKGAGKTESRQMEVSGFARGLKLLAKEFGVPVIVGSQLNRGPEMRSDHRPLPADLRDSGSVEQDSDIVILLYRDEVYEPESPRAGEIDLIVAKNRQGPLGTVTLAFRGHYAMCGEMYRPPAPVPEELPEEAA